MFGRKDTPSPQSGKITTVVGSDARIVGSVTSVGVIRIDGRFEGDIRTESDVVVGEQGYAQAKVLARHMSVAGEVRGDIQLSGRLEISSSGKVFGEITVSALAIEEGGIFKGKCDMGKNGADSGVDSPDAAAACQLTNKCNRTAYG
jgi:cytoskeletal protein CcmA (bactofilin family)